jgi:hypothetical protein
MTPEQIHKFILEQPALKPPQGVVPNFVDPPNLRNDPLTITLLLISTIVVWIRLYTKLRIVRKPVLEDCECMWSVILKLELTVLQIRSFLHGYET